MDTTLVDLEVPEPPADPNAVPESPTDQNAIPESPTDPNANPEPPAEDPNTTQEPPADPNAVPEPAAYSSPPPSPLVLYGSDDDPVKDKEVRATNDNCKVVIFTHTNIEPDVINRNLIQRMVLY